MTSQASQRKFARIPAFGVEERGTISARLKRLGRKMWRHRWLYFLLILPLTYYLIFRYIPIYNAQLAFKDFFALKGVEGSPWVGFQHFEAFFQSYYFSSLIVNTVFFSVAKLILGLP